MTEQEQELLKLNTKLLLLMLEVLEDLERQLGRQVVGTHHATKMYELRKLIYIVMYGKEKPVKELNNA